MAEPLKIKVTIAGRVYPINVKNENEEEGMRKAAKHINDLVTKFEKNYAVSDKQDVLAMCALQFASLIEINAINKDQDMTEVTEKINKLGALIDTHLEK
ncbi:MAG: cell division protein ZapA [Lutibacter sp.]|jgi:cell division protein ZapA|nr:cell division protein ZapA [Lutibacter sp.]MDO9136800.1 cell division protein ZapA [Lutibacter sp.]MDO9593822.1 cell division protein ZapA [Lutibacter sp.]MDP2069700.1 cell division protein ZapA [Lutibacter sp.]MDP3358677.1 cell division protein ZapA [Lutibacter sp.]